ncbi:GDP-mannose 4,6-dehydratase [Nocardioides sp. S-58]|uniref:GDP-mannose 4,6-dehydratase n=1 Tax=Nocardioides renjunii TaxID=3095075 RepID=A0ABU5K7Z2_9ACTN|nr:GDP-mannose 4,6-dehydratase [Nocardioides sp. S-58]MDZ5660565.1 GDP-mannose 4,6-dehydratase [Nocardioides sp. S-58]
MSNLDGRRVLVTGGAGFIGSQLVTTLLDTTGAAHVRVLDSLATGTLENLAHLHVHVEDDRLQVRVGDVVSDADEALEDVDVVFHLACLGVRHSLHDPMGNHRANAEGSLVLLQSALHRDVDRFVHVSSSEVYGTAQYAPMDELHPTHPETVYGGGKLAGEAYARAHWRTYGMPVVVARPFNTYGPRSHFEGDSGEVIPRSIVRALCGLPALVFGDGEQSRDFTHVRDTAAGLVALAECDAAVGETLNLGSGSEVSINDLATLVARVVGLEGPAATHLDARPGDVRRLIVDDSRMRSLTGWRASVDFAEGVEELVAWFRTRPQSPEEMLARIEDRNWVPA